jgi:hypothetical protein
MSEREKHAVAIGAIIIAALALFGPALIKREVFVFRDHSDYFQPMRIYTAQHLRAGRLPLWNPYNASGEPWIANPQTAVFYPPAWLFLVLPFPIAYTSYLLAHALLLGIGGYRLFLRDATRLAAAGGAIALMFSGPVLSLLDVSNNYTTFAWLPLVIVCALERRAIAGGVALAMSFLAAEPFFAAIAAVMFVVIVRNAKTIAIAASIAAGLSAVQLFPFLELIHHSNRVGSVNAEEILESSMTPRDWMRVIVHPRFAPHARQHFLLTLYVSVFIVILAIAGLVFLVREKRWKVLAGWIALIAFAMVIASGPSWLIRIRFEMFRYPARLVPFVAFALIALAVAGWTRLAGRSAIVSMLLTIAIATELYAIAQPLLVTRPFVRSRVPYSPAIGHAAKIMQWYGDAPLAGGNRASWISGYTNLLELRFAASITAPMSPRAYEDLLLRASHDLDLLRSMSIGYMLSAAPLPQPFVPIARSQQVVVYRVPQPMPLAYVITPSGERRPPRTLAIDASSARVAVDTAEGGTLVITQNDDAGWRVAIDGRDAAKKLAMTTFRAVDIAPGKHEIEWRYRPMSLVVGAIVTLITIVFIVVALILSR